MKNLSTDYLANELPLINHLRPNVCFFPPPQWSTRPLRDLGALRAVIGGETYLDLFKWDFKAEGLVVVRVQGVLLDCRLLLLQPLAVLHQVDLRIRICGDKDGILFSTTVRWRARAESGLITHTAASPFIQRRARVSLSPPLPALIAASIS